MTRFHPIAFGFMEGTATVRINWRAVDQDGVVRTGEFTESLLRHEKTWRAVRIAAGPPQIAPATEVTAPPPPDEVEAPESSEGKTRAVRMLSGVAAVVVPEWIAKRLGLFRLGGGRGFLWFTDIDTLIFDLVLLGAIAGLRKRFRFALRNPMAWLVVLLTILVGAPLVYAVTNFGTLFRLREMIYLGLMLVPLAVVTRFKPETPRLA